MFPYRIIFKFYPVHLHENSGKPKLIEERNTKCEIVWKGLKKRVCLQDSKFRVRSIPLGTVVQVYELYGLAAAETEQREKVHPMKQQQHLGPKCHFKINHVMLFRYT